MTSYSDNFIDRAISKKLTQLSKWYPVIFVTGPRQSGKSTLIKRIFNSHDYINLEEPATRIAAQTDPSGFVDNIKHPTIIDEAQNVPEIFSSIQARVDNDRIDGYFILSGSQNFLLNKNIGQTLAGRVGIAELLPLSLKELSNAKIQKDIFAQILQGQYPALFSKKIPSQVFYSNYIDTYVNRDVSDVLNIKNKEMFIKFVELSACQAGSLVNYTSMAKSIGVSSSTIKSWLSILQQSYVVYLLRPYYNNVKKSLTKTPKLYFYDSGLLSYLLGVNSCDDLFFSQHKGAIFENFVISERLKLHHNNIVKPKMFFYRDDSKIEVDLYDTTNSNQLFAEIKATSTYNTKFSRSVKLIGDQLSIPQSAWSVIYAGNSSFCDGSVNVLSVNDLCSKIK